MRTNLISKQAWIYKRLERRKTAHTKAQNSKKYPSNHSGSVEKGLSKRYETTFAQKVQRKT